jgi:hypothetical protein
MAFRFPIMPIGLSIRSSSIQEVKFCIDCFLEKEQGVADSLESALKESDLLFAVTVELIGLGGGSTLPLDSLLNTIRTDGAEDGRCDRRVPLTCSSLNFCSLLSLDAILIPAISLSACVKQSLQFS